MNTVKEYYVRMSDGVRLYTLVVLPESSGRFPLIFVRNPYVGKDVDLQGFQGHDNRDYAMVIQHCRGCGRSEGDCIPYVNERQDGLDTLAWIREQEFYNGEIYLSGGSYLASVHFAYLDTQQPDIKGAVLQVQDCNRYNIMYRNGHVKIGLHGAWAVGMYKKNSIFKKNYVNETFLTHPLKGITKSIFGEYAERLEEPLLHPNPNDDYWKTHDGGADAINAVVSTTIPILLTTAFYDIYTEGVFQMWRSIPEDRRKECALLVSPYEHSQNHTNDCPVQFPDGGISEHFGNYTLDWFDNIRKNKPLEKIAKGKITYYTLWENKWNQSDLMENGPVAHRLHINKAGLQEHPDEHPEAMTYVYNPAAPAKFKGGGCNNFNGMRIQDPPNSRYDILSFLTEEIDVARMVVGKMKARIFVKSDCEDTAFYLRVSIVKGDVAYVLRDDITSILFQHEDYVPGQEVKLDFTFGDHAFLLEPGDKLRLDVSSAAFPLFLPHTNQKGMQATQSVCKIANNTLVTAKSYLEYFTMA